MKNLFKHFIKHVECKLYINPKNDNYNINMQISKQLSNISDLHATLYNFLQKNQNFNKTLKLKKSNIIMQTLKLKKSNIIMQTSKHHNN